MAARVGALVGLLGLGLVRSGTLGPSAGWALRAWGEAEPADSTDGQEVVIVDLFDTSAADVAELGAEGHTVVCYFSAGTIEDWREDVEANEEAWDAVALGGLEQWEGEAWLDIYKLEALQALMVPRLNMARALGCHGVEPDNVDCFSNTEECAIGGTAEERRAAQIAYNAWTADYAHSLGLLVALKNAGDIVPELVASYDMSVVEQCVEFDECDVYKPFFDAGKPIFGIEYQALDAEACAAAVADHVQMKHCAGSSESGTCEMQPLQNCYADPIFSIEEPALTYSVSFTLAFPPAASLPVGDTYLGSVRRVLAEQLLLPETSVNVVAAMLTRLRRRLMSRIDVVVDVKVPTGVDSAAEALERLGASLESMVSDGSLDSALRTEDAELAAVEVDAGSLAIEGKGGDVADEGDTGPMPPGLAPDDDIASSDGGDGGSAATVGDFLIVVLVVVGGVLLIGAVGYWLRRRQEQRCVDRRRRYSRRCRSASSRPSQIRMVHKMPASSLEPSPTVSTEFEWVPGPPAMATDKGSNVA